MTRENLFIQVLLGITSSNEMACTGQDSLRWHALAVMAISITTPSKKNENHNPYIALAPIRKNIEQ